jgi:hypothetical protein
MGRIAGIAAAVTSFYHYHGCSYQVLARFIAGEDVCHIRWFSICAALSVGLLIYLGGRNRAT